MKKNYLKPETAVVSVVVKNFILEGSAGGGSTIPGGGEEPGGDGDFTNKHRGEWGNVWSN